MEKKKKKDQEAKKAKNGIHGNSDSFVARTGV
jgi:hypothetical protein